MIKNLLLASFKQGPNVNPSELNCAWYTIKQPKRVVIIISNYICLTGGLAIIYLEGQSLNPT